ncbi:MAG: hypothetical protein H7263_06350 [Candidatus Sericytochromatia bacterium]|nr:hypothetical protein [Candidatus Sericytochromatia bacterium]
MGSTSFSNKVVGIFSDSSTVDSLLDELNNNGFDRGDISVLARDYNQSSDEVVTHSTATAYPDVVVEKSNDFYRSGLSGSDVYPRGTMDPTMRGESGSTMVVEDYPAGNIGSNRFGTPDNSASRLDGAVRLMDDKVVGRDLLHNNMDSDTVTVTETKYVDKDVVDEINEERNFDDKHKVAEKDPKAMIKGATAGGVLGIVAGIGMLLIPGIGPVLAAGPLAAAITAAAGGAAIGATAGTLIGILNDEGIPNDRSDFYNRQFNKGSILVMVHTDESRASLAREILVKYNPETIDSF